MLACTSSYAVFILVFVTTYILSQVSVFFKNIHEIVSINQKVRTADCKGLRLKIVFVHVKTYLGIRYLHGLNRYLNLPISVHAT